MHRQQEIVKYLTIQLGVKLLHFEPAYTTDSAQQDFFAAKDAENYAYRYLEAVQTASDLGAELTFSGIRLNEIHGPYCDTLRQVLHLTPDNRTTACFLCVDGEASEYANLIIGGFDYKKDKLWISQAHAVALQQQAGIIPDDCYSCFASYHCARGCPERCSAQEGSFFDSTSFRCRVNQAIGRRLIETAAKGFWGTGTSSSKTPYPL
jgi:radical SAM protein with 4Fe4S-binding SPASM domain